MIKAALQEHQEEEPQHLHTNISIPDNATVKHTASRCTIKSPVGALQFLLSIKVTIKNSTEKKHKEITIISNKHELR